MKLFKHLAVDQVKDMLDKDVTVVDIRDSQSYQQGHLKGAQSVGDANIEVFVKEADKHKPMICYCYHGHSSQSAASYFAQQGFSEVYTMDGGYEAYKNLYEQS